ncbi:MAG: hypothetical protein K8F59_14735 [Rhodobacteraceae bacterium]|nr:hypothetical protein [Paracoccaceae bacterium]
MSEVERLANGDLALVWYEEYRLAPGIQWRMRTAVLGEDGQIATGGIQNVTNRAALLGSVGGDVAPRPGGGFRTLAQFYNPATFTSTWEIQDYDATGAYVVGPIMPAAYLNVGNWAITGLDDGGSALFLLQHLPGGDTIISYTRHAASEATVKGLTYVADATSLIAAEFRQGANDADDRLVILYSTASTGPDDGGDRIALVDMNGAVQKTATIPAGMRGPEPPKFHFELLDDGGIVLASVVGGVVKLQRFDQTLVAVGGTVDLALPAGSGKAWNFWVFDRPDGGLAVLMLTESSADGSTPGSAWLQYLSSDGTVLGVPHFLDQVPAVGTKGVAADFNAQGQFVMSWDQQGSNALTVRVYDLDQPATLTGRIFSDADGDGRFDRGEGVAHATVTGTAAALLSADLFDVTGPSGIWGLAMAPVTETAISVEISGTIRHASLDLGGGFGRVSLRDGREWITNVGLEIGGGGDARLFGSRAETLIGDGDDNQLSGNRAANRLDGLDGDDTLFGRGGDDRLSGGGGNDILRGGDGEDDLRGGDGDDLVSGGRGDDRIAGEAGNDRLIGQAGEDIFVFGIGDGHDRIVDFDATNASNGFGDRLELSSALWGGLALEAEDVIARFATDTPRGVKFLFDGGDSILLSGSLQSWELQWSIDIVA